MDTSEANIYLIANNETGKDTMRVPETVTLGVTAEG